VIAGFVVLANEAAGSVQDRALGEVLSRLARVAPTAVRLTKDADDLDEALRGLDGRRPVLAGGDGSLHLAVNRLRALGLADVPLGLVPLGTGNDLARGMGLSLEPAEAAETAATGTPQAMPVATRAGSDEVLVNNVHAGIGDRAARFATRLKPRLGALAYPAGAVVAGVRPGTERVAVRVDGRTVHRGAALAVVVALGPSAGGGHRVAPDAEPTEPVLDVVLIEPGSVWSRLGIGAAMVAGRDPSEHPDVERWTGREVEIEHLDRSSADWDLDGECRTWPSPVHLVVEPAAWRLVR
jgi:diacylglycerol kinase (ATP)